MSSLLDFIFSEAVDTFKNTTPSGKTATAGSSYILVN